VIQKKVCLLGAYGVGKTSLVARFVHSIFSDKYLTTVGVKIDKKSVPLEGGPVDLVIWDIYGEDDYQKVRLSYLRGASGYLLVLDGTRLKSLETAIALQRSAEATVGAVPFVVVINKADLVNDWVIDDEMLAALRSRGWKVVKTSAKTGAEVEATFTELAQAMVAAT
jgi:small GTP-binding protein